MSEARKIYPVGWAGPTGARVVRHLSGVSALDNYEPTRTYGYPLIECWEWPPSEDGYTGVELNIAAGLDIFKHARRALWLIDDGETVTPYYTVTYHETERNVGLKRYPVGLESGVLHTYYIRVKGV